jgi:hypothetical protein
VPRTTPPASIFSGPGEACPEYKSERPALPRLLVVFRELRLEPEAVQLGGAMPKPGPAHHDRPISAEYAGDVNTYALFCGAISQLHRADWYRNR